MRYVSLDIETTGLEPHDCQILEIGAVKDDLERLLPFEHLPTFHCYVKHDWIQGQPFAISMNASLITAALNGPGSPTSKPEDRFLYPQDVAGAFYAWLLEDEFTVRDPKCNEYERTLKITFAGKNFHFDHSFLRELPRWSDVIQYHHRFLDSTIAYLQRTDMKPPDLQTCLKRADFLGEVKHTAVEDAMDVVRLIRHLWL